MVLKRIFKTRNQRVLNQLNTIVLDIGSYEAHMEVLSDDELKSKTEDFRARLASGSTLDQLLPEAFAVVRESSRRVLELRHFDVQLKGGIVLHQGKIAEMKTGEGKTLAATLPAYLNALKGHVHVVTVNDYLAARDAAWVGPIYRFLGLTVGVIVGGMELAARRASYQCDIVYGTNNEFGFDYLRDNMALTLDECVQSDLAFAIVDEIDSILIDEARTPLIISGPVEEDQLICEKIDRLVGQLEQSPEDVVTDDASYVPGMAKVYKGDFIVDHKNRQVCLTDRGHEKVEQLLAQAKLVEEGERYRLDHINVLHALDAALRAHHLYQKDVHYIVSNGAIVIVDEHTGRTMEGRRWSEGLHQAVEAKERVKVQNESQTLASITLQNFFRLYDTLSGMTGTADTEAYEFQQIYGLEVIAIPTHKPMVRVDAPDRVYLNEKGKYAAIVADIQARHAKGQPILVGTASIESSELLSELLGNVEIQHQVLNAKYHEAEAQIISQAGKPSAVTIATNMAGRGTDIVLGGHWEAEVSALEDPSEAKVEAIKQAWAVRHAAVLASGGLHVLGTERNESRRIDNQLRGRSGRQGDVGSSQFYLSLEDHLLRIFASERVSSLMARLGMEEDQPIEHRMISKAIEGAQHKVEAYYFDVRKQLLKYDDVANEQRRVVYEQRRALIEAEHLGDSVDDMVHSVAALLVRRYLEQQDLIEATDLEHLTQYLRENFAIHLEDGAGGGADAFAIEPSEIVVSLVKALQGRLQSQKETLGEDVMRRLEKLLVLQVLDHHWKEHLAAMDHLRQGIHLRGYAQQDPIQAYRHESFALFESMLANIKEAVIRSLCLVQMQDEGEMTQLEAQQQAQSTYPLTSIQMQTEDSAKVGRNSLCPCGSGKKYKRCHGRIQGD